MALMGAIIWRLYRMEERRGRQNGDHGGNYMEII